MWALAWQKGTAAPAEMEAKLKHCAAREIDAKGRKGLRMALSTQALVKNCPPWRLRGTLPAMAVGLELEEMILVCFLSLVHPCRERSLEIT